MHCYSKKSRNDSKSSKYCVDKMPRAREATCQLGGLMFIKLMVFALTSYKFLFEGRFQFQAGLF